MGAIRRASYTLVSWHMEVVQHAVPQTDVQGTGEPGRVHHLARGAEVQWVGAVILHALHNPDLSSRTMAVVHCLGVERVWLVVGADRTEGWHVEQLLNHCAD